MFSEIDRNYRSMALNVGYVGELYIAYLFVAK